MRKARLIWRIFPLLFAVTILAIVALNGAAVRAMRDAAIENEFARLETVARLAGDALTVPGATPEAVIQRAAAQSGTRITLLDAAGSPLADSSVDASRLANIREAPEIGDALAYGYGAALRSSSLGQDMLFATIRARHGGEPVLVRAGVPLSAIEAALAPARRRLLTLSLLLAVAAGIASYAAYRFISAPLQRLREGAERFARGDLETRVPVPPSEELGDLAEALNQMAGQMHERYASQVAHTYELEAVLASMAESVLAVDGHTRILKLNPAGARLLKAPAEACEGRILQEVIRNRDLNDFVARTLNQDRVLEADIVLFDEGERHLQAHGAPLRNAAGNNIGGVIVLNDVTRLRRLESARSEFAANVSHELRTPITSIIGYVETLQDGALESPEDAARFLGIIARQAQRLNALIEDLLALSRIERGSETGGIERKPGVIEEVIAAAIQECAGRAQAGGIELTMEGGGQETRLPMNAQLLQQALVNLIDNAIQHSEAGSTVRIQLRAQAGAVDVAVVDQGCGIAQEHLPRLFERFYRVDEDRNRRKGGTGLGLAIVKHVVRAHNGQISVDSAPGRGSRFVMTLPVAPDEPKSGPICPEPAPVAIISPGAQHPETAAKVKESPDG